MDGDEKLIAIFLVCLTTIVLTALGWGMLSAMNTHNFDLKCLQNGKTIQYRTLQGEAETVKECK